MDMAISRIQPTKNENGEGGFANGSNVAEVEGDVDDSGAAAEEDGSSLPRLEPSSEKESSIKDGVAVVSVVISQNEARNQVLDLKTSHGNVADFCKDEKVEVLVGDAGHKRVCLQRTESYHEQCSHGTGFGELIQPMEDWIRQEVNVAGIVPGYFLPGVDLSWLLPAESENIPSTLPIFVGWF